MVYIPGLLMVIKHCININSNVYSTSIMHDKVIRKIMEKVNKNIYH